MKPETYMNTPTQSEEPLRFREVAAGTALLAFAAFSIVATVAILGTATAIGDQMGRLKTRLNKGERP